MRVLANSRLLEGHWGACQRAVVDFMFAATSVLQSCDLTAPKLSLASRFRRAAMLLIFRQSEHPHPTIFRTLVNDRYRVVTLLASPQPDKSPISR